MRYAQIDVELLDIPGSSASHRRDPRSETGRTWLLAEGAAGACSAMDINAVPIVPG